MSLVGIIASLCTLTSEPQHAEAAGAGTRFARTEARPVRTAEVRPRVAPTSVVGRVVDALGNAVADVTVIASPSAPGATRAATRARTDRAGRFRFAGLTPGEYVFVTIHGDHASSVSPAMPIEPGDRGLEVVLIVGETSISA